MKRQSLNVTLAGSGAPAMSTAFLSIRGVSRSFPAQHGGAPTVALQATDLSVAENDCVTMRGPSGCVKSTLLRIFA